MSEARTIIDDGLYYLNVVDEHGAVIETIPIRTGFVKIDWDLAFQKMLESLCRE